MNIEFLFWTRNGIDYQGEEQPVVYYIVINGQDRAVGRRDLIRAIEMKLPQRKEEHDHAEASHSG